MSEPLLFALDRASAVAMLGALFAVAYLALAGWRMRRAKMPLDGSQPPNRLWRPAIALFLCVFTCLMLGELSNGQARDLVAGYLAPASNPRLRIDGKVPSTPAPLLDALRAMRAAEAHHSHPTRRFIVDIDTDRGSLRIELARDSQRPDEYWVMVPKFWTTSNTDVARVWTRALDGLQDRRRVSFFHREFAPAT